LITSLWNVIQSDSILRNNTTLIVTNDHGRHTYDFSNHGDGCEGCRHIMLLIVGPDTPSDAVDCSPHTQVDIAPTIGALIGFQTPNSTGMIIQSAFVTYNCTEPPSPKRAFYLHQNYPNPFNLITTIYYELPQIGRSQAVSLRVMDSLGHEVAILVDENKQAGFYQVQWDASKLSSGAYFCQLKYGNYNQTRKMILLK
jgi:hypothetical protein